MLGESDSPEPGTPGQGNDGKSVILCAHKHWSHPTKLMLVLWEPEMCCLCDSSLSFFNNRKVWQPRIGTTTISLSPILNDHVFETGVWFLLSSACKLPRQISTLSFRLENRDFLFPLLSWRKLSPQWLCPRYYITAEFWEQMLCLWLLLCVSLGVIILLLTFLKGPWLQSLWNLRTAFRVVFVP